MTVSRLRTDKAANGYLPTYLTIAGQIGIAGRVCEIGVQGGGSLQLWQTLFPDGQVVGVDHDPGSHWPAGTVQVISDQADPDLPARLTELAPGGFDLIVDDASHAGHLTRRTWELLWPLVTPAGWYVIEDWGVAFRGDAPMYEPSMFDAVVSLLHCLRPGGAPGRDVDAITYRPGMVILRKKGRE